ncbi:MAG: 2-oxo acid dehydrogenase subunit E2 [Ferruginibacter sp.]
MPDQLNLTGLTKQVNNLANAARTGKLKPDDTTGGTFTLTNCGHIRQHYGHTHY